MRIVDAVAAFATRPDTVVAVGAGAASVCDALVDELGLAHAEELTASGLLVVAVEGEDVQEQLSTRLQDGIPDGGQVLALFEQDPATLPVDDLIAVLEKAAAVALDVLAVSHPAYASAVHVGPAGDSATARLHTEVTVQRASLGAATVRLEMAERELERRVERIAALQQELEDVRSRFRDALTERERELAASNKQVVRLERDVDQLEGSTSYRLGHLLVRLVQEPQLWRQLFARLRASVRR